MNKIVIILIIVGLSPFYKANAQEKVYAFLGQYLVKKQEIDSAIYRVKKIDTKRK